MYYSFIYPYLTYGSILWGNNYYSPISDVVKLQNRAIRIINDVLIPDNITPHYVILKFPDIVKLHTCLFLYDHLCDANPPNFRTSLLWAALKAGIRNPESKRNFKTVQKLSGNNVNANVIFFDL